MARAAKKKVVEAEKPVDPHPLEAIRYDEDFTAEEWAYIREVSRRELADDEFIIVSGPAW